MIKKTCEDELLLTNLFLIAWVYSTSDPGTVRNMQGMNDDQKTGEVVQDLHFFVTTYRLKAESFMFSVVAKVIGNIVFNEIFGKAAEMLERFNHILPVLVPIFDLCLMPLIIVIFSYFHCSAPSNFPSIIMDQGSGRKFSETTKQLSTIHQIDFCHRNSATQTSRWGMLSQGIAIVHLQTQVPRISTQSNTLI